MPNPFPGVDPFIESQHYWQDFHATFVPSWRETISKLLPRDYEARIDERVQIVGLDALGDRSILPDVAVSRQDEHRPTRQGHAMQRTSTAETATLQFPVMDEVRESLIEIFHRPKRTLVAVLELLSPTNKINPGRGQYLAKRNELLTQPVHLIEVDLLTVGERLPMRRPLPPGDCYAIVSRSEARRTGKVYAWTLREPMPRIPIPLLSPQEDIVSDLGAVFALAFERGDYARSIDYHSPLEIPLDDSTRRWAEEIGRGNAIPG